jgi:hypothetical protein
MGIRGEQFKWKAIRLEVGFFPNGSLGKGGNTHQVKA